MLRPRDCGDARLKRVWCVCILNHIGPGLSFKRVSRNYLVLIPSNKHLREFRPKSPIYIVLSKVREIPVIGVAFKDTLKLCGYSMFEQLKVSQLY